MDLTIFILAIVYIVGVILVLIGIARYARSFKKDSNTFHNIDNSSSVKDLDLKIICKQL